MRGICKMRPGVGAEFRDDLPIPEINDDEVLMKVHPLLPEEGPGRG